MILTDNEIPDTLRKGGMPDGREWRARDGQRAQTNVEQAKAQRGLRRVPSFERQC